MDLTLLSSLSASKTAPAKFIVVCVWPIVWDHTSSIPAKPSMVFPTFPIAKPTPPGAGISVTRTLPFLPSILNGTVCSLPQTHPQSPQPLLTFIILYLALSTAFLIAGPTSLAFPCPSPTYPFLFPTATITLKLTLRPDLCIL